MTNQPELPGTKHYSSANRGKNFEAELSFVHDFYRGNGWIDMVKNAEKWEFINPQKYQALERKNPGSVAKTAAGYCMQMHYSDIDFSGGNGERAFAFDAKETKQNNFPFAKVSDGQIHRLKQSARCGVKAGLMIKFSTLDRVFFVLIGAFAEKHEKWFKASQTGTRAKPGEASLSIAELEEIGIEIKRKKVNLMWDWFPMLNC